MLLYDNAISGNCYKVRLLFAHLGTKYERRELSVADRTNRPGILGGLNPSLRVPTIVLDDGRSLGESNAILWYFGVGTRYVPPDPFDRAQVLQWQFYEQYDHEPNIAVARFWLHYKKGDIDRAALAQKQAGGYRALDAMEAHLGDREFFVGKNYSIADISLYAYTHVAEEGGFEMARYPAIQRWLGRVKSQPGHITIDA
jgi:glutathione S-transferase